jgi:hypothetical protein
MLSRMRIAAFALTSLALLACPRAGDTTTDPPEPSEPNQPNQPNQPVTEPTSEASGATADPSLCTLGPRGSWAACEGARVQMIGRAPEMVGQHPMMDGGPDELHQSYLDYDGVEVIVLTKAEVACSGEMLVIGTLRGISGGGAPGTKDSYVGWTLEQAEVTCR